MLSLFYPCKRVFVEQRERLTNTFLPALFLCGVHIKCIYTAKIKKEYPQKIRLRILRILRKTALLWRYYGGIGVIVAFLFYKNYLPQKCLPALIYLL